MIHNNTIPFRRQGLEKPRIICYNSLVIGDWPSGKALVSGTSIRGFESLIPSHEIIEKTTD